MAAYGQSLSEVEQERFRQRNERLLLEEVGIPPSLTASEIGTRSHSPETSDRVYAVSSYLTVRAPAAEDAVAAWYATNPGPYAPSDAFYEEVLVKPIWEGLDEMIAKFEKLGFDRVWDEIHDPHKLYSSRGVELSKAGLTIQFSGSQTISIKRYS